MQLKGCIYLSLLTIAPIFVSAITQAAAIASPDHQANEIASIDENAALDTNPPVRAEVTPATIVAEQAQESIAATPEPDTPSPAAIAPAAPASLDTAAAAAPLGIQPSDPAFQTLQALADRYGCLEADAQQRLAAGQAIAQPYFEQLLAVCASAVATAGNADDLAQLAQLNNAPERLGQTTEELPNSPEETAPEGTELPIETGNPNFSIRLSGSVTVELGAALSGQGDAFFDASNNRITLPRDFASLPGAGTSVAGGNAAAGAAGVAQLGTGTLASFSGAVQTAANTAATVVPPNDPFTATGFADAQELANALAVNLGLGPAGAQAFLQGFANAGVNLNNPAAPGNGLALAAFHQGLAGTFANAGDAKIVIVNPQAVDDNLALDVLGRLTLDTTFTGDDLLTFSWLAFNSESYAARTGAPEAELETWSDRRSNNFVELYELYYRFWAGDVQVYIGAKDLYADDIVPTTANLQDDTLAAFFSENPLSYSYAGGTGIGANYQLSDQFNIAAAFLASDGFYYDEDGDEEIFADGNTLFAQLTYQPNDRFVAALTFNRAYSPDYLGLEATVVPNLFLARQKPTVQRAIALNMGYEFSEAFTLSGWLGYEWANTQGYDANFNRFSWALNLGFPDLFAEGNYGGFSIGAFPYVTRESGRFLESEDTPILAQAFYRIQMTDNFSIQPGLFYVANPTGNVNREDIWVGSVRAQFTF
jgi:hypothetical protein